MKGNLGREEEAKQEEEEEEESDLISSRGPDMKSTQRLLPGPRPAREAFPSILPRTSYLPL